MKILTASIITLLIGLVAAQEFSCPKDGNLICLDGSYSYPDNCTWYYMCEDCQYTINVCDTGLHFDDSENICRDPYLAECDPNFARNGSAFCVYFDETDPTTIVGPVNPLRYSHDFVNYKYPYDPVTGYWQAAHTGHFVFHMCAGTVPGEMMNMSQAGTPYAWNNVRHSAHHQQDVVSRDMIMKLAHKFIVAVIVPDGFAIGNHEGKPSAWCGFEIEEFQNVILVFFAISSVYHRPPVGTPETIVFENQMIDVLDTGNADNYNAITGQFVAPRPGYYYFMFATGVEANQDHRSHFVHNSVNHLSELYRGTGLNTGIDTISKTTITYMAMGDTMEVVLMSGQATNNQSTILSYGGFLINPNSDTPERLWFVTTHTMHSASANPMDFENVVYNQGNLFNPVTDKINIDTNGTYYISYYSGLTATDTIKLTLVRETSGPDENMVNVWRSNAYQTDIDMIGRTILVHLLAGDSIYLKLEEGVSYSNSDTLTTFSGFLLHNIDDPTAP